MLAFLLLYNKHENESEFASMSLSRRTAQEPEEPAPSEEIFIRGSNFPKKPILPEDFTPLGRDARLPTRPPQAGHRMLALPGADERAALLDDLARRAFPSFEFFLFALFCGAVLGAAFLLDSPALLLLGVLLAPLLTPWVGLTLATMTGSWRFFFMTSAVLLVAGLLVFLHRGAGRVGRASLAAPATFPGRHPFAPLVAGPVHRGIGRSPAGHLVRPF